MADSLAGDVAYLLEVIRMATFGAGLIYTLIAAIDSIAGGYELIKCRQLDSQEVAQAISVILFLVSGLLIVTVLAYWLTMCCSDVEREERESEARSRQRRRAIRQCALLTLSILLADWGFFFWGQAKVDCP